MKKVLISALGAAAALSSAQTVQLASPGEWSFDYSGRYAFASATTNGNVATLLSTALGAQLSLLQGNVTASQTTSIAQSGTSVSTSSLAFTATSPGGILPGLGAFLVNALNTANGPYSGTITNTALTLRGPSVADVAGSVDARVGGTGFVYSLRASLVDSVLAGTVDGVQNGVGDHVAGTAGRSGLLAISLGTQTYLDGLLTASIPSTQVGAISMDANSWSLARPSVQATPEPASLAALGVGVVALARRRRRAA